MIGMSNGMNIGDEFAPQKKQHHTEQQDKKD
jgi:hypothetical protein